MGNFEIGSVGIQRFKNSNRFAIQRFCGRRKLVRSNEKLVKHIGGSGNNIFFRLFHFYSGVIINEARAKIILIIKSIFESLNSKDWNIGKFEDSKDSNLFIKMSSLFQ
jgi:hypothetical protein